MSSRFSSLPASLIARQVARVSRPRPWIVPAPVVKPAPVACSTAVPSSTFSSLSKSVIARVTARTCRPQALSTISSSASSKRSIVGGRQSPVSESVHRQTTLSARASARASRDRPWLNPRADSIAAKVSKSKSTTARWIQSQAVDLRQAPRQPSSIPIRHSPTSDTSMSIPAPPIVMPKRRTANIGARQASRYPSTSNNRPGHPSSSSSSLRPQRVVPPASPEKSIAEIVREARAFDINEFRASVQPIYDKLESHRKWLRRLTRKPRSLRPQQVVPTASPEKSIAEIVREARAFDINQFRAEVQPIYDKIESHHKWLRRLTRKPVTFNDNPTVIEHPRWIEKEHVFGGPPRMMGQILAWRPFDDTPYEHILVWGTDPSTSGFDHSDCENPGCHRRAKDLYMDNYEEWTAPTFTTISE